MTFGVFRILQGNGGPTEYVASLVGSFLSAWSFFRGPTKRQVHQVGEDLQEFRKEANTQFTGLRPEVNGLRTEMHEEFRGLRNDLRENQRELRGDIADLRTEVRDGFTGLRGVLLEIRDRLPPQR